MPSSLHWWNWTKPQESFWRTFAKYTHAQQHSWASCGATFQLHGPLYFRCPGAWCGDGSMQWNRHPTEAAWNEGFLAVFLQNLDLYLMQFAGAWPFFGPWLFKNLFNCLPTNYLPSFSCQYTSNSNDNRELKQRRFWATHINRKWDLLPFYMPWH